MQKGYKREAKGMAVLRCLIGVFIVIVVVLLGYFMLRLDYSDKLDPDASMRPYVEVTPSPVPTAVPSAEPVKVTELPEDTSSDENGMPAAVPAAATEAPTAEPTATPEPTPEPTPIPTATPVPTQIPESAISRVITKGLKLPEPSTKTASLGITHSYRSAMDDFKLLQVQGFAYVDVPGFDGTNAEVYLVVMDSTGKFISVVPSKINGISGVEHADAVCANASASDFEAVINVDHWPDEIYSLSVVFIYDDNGVNCVEHYSFPYDATFTVLGNQVISDIQIPEA